MKSKRKKKGRGSKLVNAEPQIDLHLEDAEEQQEILEQIQAQNRMEECKEAEGPEPKRVKSNEEE